MEVEIFYSDSWSDCPCGVECVRTPGAPGGARERLRVVRDSGSWALLVTLEPPRYMERAFGCTLLAHECETLLDYLTWVQAVTTSIRVNGRPWLTCEDTPTAGCANGRALWRAAVSDPAIVGRALDRWERTGVWPRGVPATAGRPPEEVLSDAQRMLEG